MVDLEVRRGWRTDVDVLAAVREVFSYGSGEDRATGYLYTSGEHDWPALLAELGPELLDRLDELLGIRYPIVAFQAYRNGSGCGWHADDPFDAQAILSLGVTRTFGIKPRTGGEPIWTAVAHGDLVVMPSGFQPEWLHCIPEENVTGERVSLVFRTRS